MVAKPWPTSGPETGSLVSPMVRDTAILLISAAGAVALSRMAPAADQPIVWLLGGLVIGLACGLIGGWWLGLLFIAAGLSIGVWLDLDRHSEPAFDTLHVLGAVAPAYLAAIGGASATYAGVLLVVRRVRASGLIQRPSR